jgi:hypothetical protein
VEFIIASKSKKIAVECPSREPRLRRLTTTLTTPMDIHKTNVHQLTANSPIINTPRNTVKKPRPALNAHEDLPTLAINPPDQAQTHKMGLDMATVERRRYEEYEEDVEYKEYEEFNTDRNIAKRHITSKFEEDYKLQEVQCPSLRGGCNQDEFQAFIQQWSLYRGHNSGRDEMELRHQLVNSIDGPLKNDMYNVLGSNTSTISETAMLDVLEKEDCCEAATSLQ